MEYFFIGLSLPNESFWVNLRPDSPDNIIDTALAQTDIGKILLEADVQLKKDTALYTSPQTTEGKAYWDKLYKKAEELYGYDNITIPTLTRPWIVPCEIIIRETPDNAYIYKATLKVMLEEDYLKNVGADLVSARNQDINKLYEFNDPRAKELNTYSTQLIKELIIPKLTEDINTSKRYAALRQVYYSLILAQWFKSRVSLRGASATKQSFNEIACLSGRQASPSARNDTAYIQFINSGNLYGLTSKTPWTKDTYYQQYQKSFTDGEYNLKEPMHTPYGQTIRSYFSGGVSFDTGAMSSAIKIRISPVNQSRDIADVLVSSAVNEHNFRAVFSGSSIDGKLSIFDEVKGNVEDSLAKEQEKNNITATSSAIERDIFAEYDKQLKPYFKKNDTGDVIEDVQRKIKAYNAINDIDELLDKSLTLIPYFEILDKKVEELKKVSELLNKIKKQLQGDRDSFNSEKERHEKRKKMFLQRLFHKKEIDKRIKFLEEQIVKIEELSRIVKLMDETNWRFSLTTEIEKCRQDIYIFVSKDITRKVATTI